MRRHAGLLIVALLSGCAGAGVQCPIPKTVTLTVTKYVPLDLSVTEHLPIEQRDPTDKTCGEAVRVAKVRASTIEQCNIRLDQIRQSTTP